MEGEAEAMVRAVVAKAKLKFNTSNRELIDLMG